MKNLVSEFQIKYKKNFKTEELKTCNSSQLAAEYFRSVWDGDIDYLEKFFVMCLNRANQVIGVSLISVGGMSGVVADGKVIFTKALLSGAHAIILAHNHPSGQLKPSDADKTLTSKLVSFGKMIELPVLDHVILTENSYYSFADNSLI